MIFARYFLGKLRGELMGKRGGKGRDVTCRRVGFSTLRIYLDKTTGVSCSQNCEAENILVIESLRIVLKLM